MGIDDVSRVFFDLSRFKGTAADVPHVLLCWPGFVRCWADVVVLMGGCRGIVWSCKKNQVGFVTVLTGFDVDFRNLSDLQK